MRNIDHPEYELTDDPSGLWLTVNGSDVCLDRRIDVQELHAALGEYLAETQCARCDGTGRLDDIIDGSAPCPDCLHAAGEVEREREMCKVCKGFGRYQDGDSGTDADGRAPNIVECDCADSERFPSPDDAAAPQPAQQPNRDAARLREALSTARDYVYGELENRKQALAGYPHKWQQEEADLAAIDAALAQSGEPRL